MDRFSHIRWYGWAIFAAILYLTFPQLVNTLFTVNQFKGNSSPLLPFYYKHVFIIVNGISIFIGLFTLLGIGLYLFRRRTGWCFLYSVSIYLIFYNGTLFLYFFADGAAFLYTILSCILSLGILVLLLVFSRKKFHIRTRHIITYSIFTLLIIFVELNKIDVAFALSRLFS